MRTLLLSLLLASGCDAGSVDDKTDVREGETGSDGVDGCGDADGASHTGATELCDGIDNNCDGVVDEGLTRSFYQDVDRDGFGDPGTTDDACSAQAGYVENAADCDDGEIEVHPGAAEACNGIDDNCDGAVDEGVVLIVYTDADDDGYGELPVEACVLEDGFAEVGEDCDDSDPEAFPGNPEVCDEVDNDCDGTVDEGVTTTYYADRDGDAWGDVSLLAEACALPTGYAEQADDCDDADASVNPAAPEVCDGADQNCDGVLDEGFDGDGDWIADCFDVEECDGLDNDGDGEVDESDAVDARTWYLDYDGDGWGGARFSAIACYAPPEYVTTASDCDDEDPARSPDATEVCDGIDQDCDGAVDEGLDADGDSLADCEDTEECDGVDNDGDGDVDDGFDSDGDTLADCYDQEECDGVDNDGDGRVDDADTEVLGTSTWYADDDADGFGDPSRRAEACEEPSGYVSDATDCGDADEHVFPGAPERCNGVDDDCDGAIDDDAADADGDGTCDAYDSEGCDGLDNDGDGSADEGLSCSYRLVRSDLSTGLCVDDDLYVNLNGSRIYTDPWWGAQCGHVVSFTATPGDTLTIWAVDSVGSCRAIDDVYIVNVAGGVGRLLTAGVPNSCGHSASTAAFWSATVAVPGAF
ncbi:MAG: putative metal-binding motif-containing protein [Pseudomonadota bacterium]|nr:putative metal-binding motif-containing protein [Pseudomonadota bacterium]